MMLGKNKSYAKSAAKQLNELINHPKNMTNHQPFMECMKAKKKNVIKVSSLNPRSALVSTQTSITAMLSSTLSYENSTM